MVGANLPAAIVGVAELGDLADGKVDRPTIRCRNLCLPWPGRPATFTMTWFWVNIPSGQVDLGEATAPTLVAALKLPCRLR